jgi:predicted dehydrogenase
MMKPMINNRREFLISGAALAAFSQARVLGANDRIRIGAIGTGGRMRGLLECLNRTGGNDIVAVCDVYEPRRQEVRQRLAPNATEYLDYRQLLEHKDIDAVVIASPDHWHVPMTIDAVQAGKDVYLEKPVTHTLEEGPRLVKAVRDSGRIVQVGTQQRSWEHFRTAAEMVAAGKLGKVTLIRTYWFQNYLRSSNPQIDTSKLDWKRWLGSAPDQPFDINRFTTWRWYWDFGGGALTDLFSHWVDVVHWAMKSDTPQFAQTLANRFAFEWECPDTIQASFQYPNFLTIYDGTMVASLEDGGLIFRGTAGEMRLDRARLTVYPEPERSLGPSRLPEPSLDIASKEDGTIAHMRNFLDCLRSRAEPNAPIEAGVAAARAAHLGNLAYKYGARITWPLPG